MKPDSFLYEEVAAKIENSIAAGNLRPGDKIPSVRKLHEKLGVSLSTVMQAYVLLEERGKIEARPQSGFYVRCPSREDRNLPTLDRKLLSPVKVGNGNLMTSVFENGRNPKILPLGSASVSPEFLPGKQLNRIVKGLLRKSDQIGLSYDYPPGVESLRVQIARRAIETGCHYSPDEVLITNGAMEAIHLCLKAITKPGDAVAIESPTYYGILHAIESLGLRAVEIPTCAGIGMLTDKLRTAVKTMGVKACIVTTNFNNPLGCSMPEEFRREIAKLSQAENVPVIEDDAFGELYFGNSRPPAIKSFDEKGLVLFCSSFSKTLAPGYRVGWVSGGRYAEEIKRLKFSTSVATATLPQLAIAEFLKGGYFERHVRGLRRTLQRNTSIMTDAVLKHFPDGTKVSRPEGGFVLWVELPKECDSMELYERALAKGIGFVPGPAFSPRQSFRNFLRLQCGAPWTAKIEKGIATLGELAKRF